MMNLPPLSGQTGADAWMGPGGSIPALRPGSTLGLGELSSSFSLACGSSTPAIGQHDPGAV